MNECEPQTGHAKIMVYTRQNKRQCNTLTTIKMDEHAIKIQGGGEVRVNLHSAFAGVTRLGDNINNYELAEMKQ